MIGVLAWGAGTAISHRAAGALWRLARCEPAIIEITVPRTRKREHAPGMVYRRALRDDEITTRYGIPVTTVERTLLDLATVVPAEVAEIATDDAVRRRLTSLRRLGAYVEGAGARPGVTVMREILAARDPRAAVPMSVFETLLFRHLRQARLPEPVRQHPVDLGNGRTAFVDFAYPDHLIAIEADGFAGHSARPDWEHDRARRNELTLLGWRVIHITWVQLTTDPAAAIATIVAALEDSP